MLGVLGKKKAGEVKEKPKQETQYG